MIETAIEKSYYYYFCNFIKKHLDMLLNSRVYIFGAGIRGRNLLRVLLHFQISDIVFVDNDPQKQGEHLDDFPIISFDAANACNKKHVFLCPIEKGQLILQQLNNSGRCENKDFFNLDFQPTDYLDVLKELERPAHDDLLVFGSCDWAFYLLGDKPLVSMGDRFKQYISHDRCKVYFMPAFAQAMYYHIANGLIQMGKISKQVLLPIVIATFSPYFPMLMKTSHFIQHNQIIEQLLRLLPSNIELSDYSRELIEIINHSVVGNGVMPAKNTSGALMKKMQLFYNFKINDKSESIGYLKKLLSLFNNHNISVMLYFPPTNYFHGESVCGESFSKILDENIKGVLSLIGKYKYDVLNLSFNYNADFFVEPFGDPNLFVLNKLGQNQVLDALGKQEFLKPYFNERKANLHDS